MHLSADIGAKRRICPQRSWPRASWYKWDDGPTAVEPIDPQ